MKKMSCFFKRVPVLIALTLSIQCNGLYAYGTQESFIIPSELSASRQLLGTNPSQIINELSTQQITTKALLSIDNEITTVIPQSQMSAAATSQETDAEANFASNVLDNNSNTMWHTKWDKSNPLPQSITLNLGGSYHVTQFKYLPRQTGNSNGNITQYTLSVSVDGSNFTQVSAGTWRSNRNEKTVSFNANNVSFIRLEALEGDGGWASAAELNVYGVQEFGPAQVPTNITAVPLGDTEIKISWDITTEETYDLEIDGTMLSQVIPPYKHIQLLPGTRHSYRVRATNEQGTSKWSTPIEAITTDTTLIPDAPKNLALGKPVISSSNETSDFIASKAVDGKSSTRWSTKWSDPQWIYVDLGNMYTIQRVKISWEAAYASSFSIQISNDAVNWIDAYTTTTGSGGITDINVTPTQGRYVRMYGLHRGTKYGYSIWELEVYDEMQGEIPSIIPRPVKATKGTGEFILSPNTKIYIQGNTTDESEEIYQIGEFLENIVSVSTGYPFEIIRAADTTGTIGNTIFLTTKGASESLGDEGYTLSVTPQGVVVKAFKPEGIFRGIQSIRQLLPPDIECSSAVSGITWNIPSWEIIDYPSYSYRGTMLDVSRHFISVDQVKRSIDLMAQYKLNKLHLHLTDDQGWRIEIKSWPKLTTVGGSTQVGGGAGGYYTQEQFIELVNYAKTRYVEVIPEIDMPGHCNAALASYGELNPNGVPKNLYTGTNVGFSTFMCHSETTYRFLDDVIRELATISPSSYIHIGGDEAASTSSADYDYFISRVTDLVAKYNKKVIGWNGTEAVSGAHNDSVMQHWHGNTTTAMNKNMKVIVSPADKTYLDMKYNSNTPIGLTWAGYNPTDDSYMMELESYGNKTNIFGVEAPLWTETVVTQNDIEYMQYPRLPGFGEIGWTPNSLRSWDEYKVRLSKQQARWINQEINFYKDPVVPWKN